jgi:hypothetical protein
VKMCFVKKGRKSKVFESESDLQLESPQNSELIRFGFFAKKPNLISSVMKMS